MCRRGRIACAAVALLAFGWAGAGRGEPRMPGSYEVEHSQPKNLSWREMGTLPMAYAGGMRTLKGTLEEQGYVLAYEIPLAVSGGSGPKSLMQWEKDRERIIVMIWEKQDGNTGLSWGVSE